MIESRQRYNLRIADGVKFFTCHEIRYFKNGKKKQDINIQDSGLYRS